MHRLLRPWRTTLIMLLMAALLVVPLLDALGCAQESGAGAAALVQLTADPVGDDGQDGHADACSHNHCHHASQGLPASSAAAFGLAFGPRWRRVGEDATYAVAQDELARPPRP